MTIHDTLKERGNTHGNFEHSAAMVEQVLEILEATPKWRLLTPPMKYSIRLTIMKYARVLHGDPEFPDHWHDVTGYNTLVYDILTKKPEPVDSKGYPKWMSEEEPNRPGTPADGGHHEPTGSIAIARPSEEDPRDRIRPPSRGTSVCNCS